MCPTERHSYPKNDDYARWYDEVYPELAGCGLWLRGNEINTLRKEEYNSRPFRVLFARLSTYGDVASSFTHLLLYQIACGLPEVFADLAYLPPANDAKIFDRDNIPWLLGTQTKFGPEKFSMIGFSNSVAQEIINIPKFLTSSGIPLKKSERLKNEDMPLVVLGGANSMYTTAIWGEDPLVYGVFTGTCASGVRELLKICADGRKNAKTKPEILRDLNEVPGFYLPGEPGKTSNAKTPIQDNIEPLENGIVLYDDEELGTGYLQISESCRASCSFCAENWNRKPYRELKSNALLPKAIKMKAEMGLEKINLFSFNFNMYSEFYKLVWGLLPVFKEIGLKSQRFDMFASDEDMVLYQNAIGKTTFSCALEGISPRLRRYLNKNLDDNALYKSLEIIFRARARELKIFLLSTGIETDDDFQKFDRLLDGIKKRMQESDASSRIIFSVTPLVKFPWTPLEFDRAYPPEDHDRVALKIKRIVDSHKFQAREAMDTKEYLISQILVRASDNRITKALLRSLDNTDFVYYRKINADFYNSFIDNLKNEGLTVDALLSGFTLEESLKKPWAVFETGIDRKFLWDVYQKNINFTEVGLSMDNVKIERPKVSSEKYKDLIIDIKKSEVDISFYARIGDSCRGLTRKYFGIALARALMKADESLIPYFKRYVSSRWAIDESAPVWIIGDDVITLSWDKGALPILSAGLNNENFVDAVNIHLARWGELKSAEDKNRASFKLKIESPCEFDGSDYFKKKGLKYTLRRSGESSYYFEFTKDALKKNAMSQFSYVLIKSGSGISNRASIDMIPGSKFDPEEFLKEAFIYRRKNDWVKAVVNSARI